MAYRLIPDPIPTQRRDPGTGRRRRAAWRALLPLTGAASLLLAGCAYDPYTGTYVPCCAAPGYAYATPYPYAAAPGGSPQSGPAEAENAGPGPYPAAGPPPYPSPYPSSQYPSSPYPSGQAAPARPGPTAARPRLAQRFAQANVTRDGRLTLAQAQQAGWRVVVRNFAAIDTGQKGYVTLGDIESWLASRQAPTGQPG